WRSVKYECVYMRELTTVSEEKEQIGSYFEYYNNERPHQSLNYKTPKAIYLL
ncbi:MAG: transposase, partial [Gammaproteobacteria bacterium]|nr:transposase [Gammaproteobacteria bacterium]